MTEPPLRPPGGSNGRWMQAQGGLLHVHVALILVHVGYAGYQVLSSIVLKSGLSPLIFLVYRNILALVFLVPVAFYSERKERPPINFSNLFRFFQLGVTGIFGSQVLFLVGMAFTNATFASVMLNTSPIFTFVMATLLGLEQVNYRRPDGVAKVFGTVICVAGALLMSVYQGPVILGGGYLPVQPDYESEPFSLRVNFEKQVLQQWVGKWQFGALILILQNLAWSGYIILQSQTMRKYHAPITTTTWAYAFATVLLLAVAVWHERDLMSWKISGGVQLLAVGYSGVVVSGMLFTLQAWGIKNGGPLLVVLYSPLETAVVAFLDLGFLNSSLYLGSLLGAIAVAAGLYTVTWGQAKYLQLKSAGGVETLEEAARLLGARDPEEVSASSSSTY